MNQQFRCKKTESSPPTWAATDFVCNAPVIFKEVEQVIFYGGSMLHFIFMGEKHHIAGYGTEVHQLLFQILEVVVLFLIAI